MITTIYTAEKNTSFRKATKWFMDHEIPFRQVFISKETSTQEEFKKILQMTDEGLSGLIKRTADKELIEELPLSEALELLIDDPLLIRSPIICNKKIFELDSTIKKYGLSFQESSESFNKK